MNRMISVIGNARMLFVLAGFASLSSPLAVAQLDVFVDSDNHFVMQSDGFEVLGIQLESASGSLVPGSENDTGPFELSLMNNPSVVMFGSLGSSVQVDGEVKLPTQWNPEGQKDVGFRWGSPEDEGSASVIGHDARFVTSQNKNAPDAIADGAITIGLEPQGTPTINPVEPPILGGDVSSETPNAEVVSASDAATSSGETSPKPIIVTDVPGYIGLELLEDPLLIYLERTPEFESVTVTSADGLLEPLSFTAVGVSVVSQNESSATFSFDDQLLDGAYPLPLRWLGSDVDDVSLTISPPNDSVLLEVLGAPGTLVALPEPSSLTLSLICLCLPFVRKRRR